MRLSSAGAALVITVMYLVYFIQHLPFPLKRKICCQFIGEISLECLCPGGITQMPCFKDINTEVDYRNIFLVAKQMSII